MYGKFEKPHNGRICLLTLTNNKIMTSRELYDWAVEHGIEEYDIHIDWVSEYGFWHGALKEEQLSLDREREQVTIYL